MTDPVVHIQVDPTNSPSMPSWFGEVATLLTEVKEAVPVPIRGVISDGQQTIRQAVARCLPDVPHQLCHFHYLDEAAEPIFEADRHTKTELKKLVRGVRPLERALEGGEDSKTDAMRSYCLAVRSALTDDGHLPLCASGLKLHAHLTQISDSLARVEEKRGSLQPVLNELHRLLARALKKTEAVWPEIEQAYALLHQAAHVLANHEDEKGQAVRERYQGGPDIFFRCFSRSYNKRSVPEW